MILGYPIIYGCAVLCQIYYYSRVSTPIERQRTKWAAADLVVTLVANQLFWLPQIAPPQYGLAPFIFISLILYALRLMLVQVIFFIALQRYRLYDIDIFINRALIYGALTATLAAIYLLGVLGRPACPQPVRWPHGKRLAPADRGDDAGHGSDVPAAAPDHPGHN